MLVEDDVIVELQAVESILPVHKAQLLSYLKLSNKKCDLLINFNVELLKDGLVRMVN
jgi:GxxExxY protein